MKRGPESGDELEERPKVRRTLVRAFSLPSWLLLFVITVAVVTGLEVGGWLQYAPFALSLVLFGLPHGAVDHLVPARLYDRRASIGSIVGVFVLYLILAGLYLILWFVSPAAAFAFFIALTWFHWGQGDLYFLAALEPGTESEPVILKALTGFLRGGFPMLVPLLAFPNVYRSVATSIVDLFGGDVSALGWVFGSVFRGISGTGFFLVLIFVLCWRYLRSSRHGPDAWRLDALEVGLLTAYFAAVPPILALGLYFCLWHSPRHVARLMLLGGTPAASLKNGRVGPALASFVRDAAPLTGAALALLVGLYFLVPDASSGFAGFLSVYLVLISALTLPHVMIVCMMDLRQGIWR